MASLYIANREKGATDIDYSLVDGRVRKFVKHGKVLYDEENGIVEEGWEVELVKTVLENGLDIDKGRGLSAFVYRLQEDGLICLRM